MTAGGGWCIGSEGAEAVGVVAGGGVVAAGGVRVAALVRGHHHAAVRRQPLHPLLHAAVAVRAPEVAPVMAYAGSIFFSLFTEFNVCLHLYLHVCFIYIMVILNSNFLTKSFCKDSPY